MPEAGVCAAPHPSDALATAYFVPQRDLGQYADEEKVQARDENGRLKLRVHKRGTFIYRLAKRDRQKSASYYTPESLTRTVVKHALAELVTDATPADDILNVTLCELAMGSAAFLKRSREPAGADVPGTQASRAEPPHRPRGLRR